MKIHERGWGGIKETANSGDQLCLSLNISYCVLYFLKVLRRDILWETYMTTKLISGTDLQLLKRYDKMAESYKCQLLDDVMFSLFLFRYDSHVNCSPLPTHASYFMFTETFLPNLSRV